MDSFEFWALWAAGVALVLYLAGYYDGSVRRPPTTDQHCKCSNCRKENKHG
jgi:hypothetical protein